ncbi:MAG TPA: T9SS type A sorting domain-containing protein, partial [Bacteroidales bacterium]|nr:T9SS type A sorting domain-containing protein [Bacteroidales bacterium]
WNDTTDTWIGYEKYVYAYNDNGNYILSEYYDAWNDTTNTWIGSYKEVYDYNTKGWTILYEYYNDWNDTTNTWIGNYKEVYAYDSDNNLLLEEFYNWSDSTGTWIGADKFTRTYAHGNELNFYHYEWNTVSNNWQEQEIEKTIGTTHPNGGISLRMAYQWNGSTWDTVAKWETMAYDTLGNMLETEVIFFTYTSPIWDELQKIIYTWDSNGKWTEIIIYNYNSGTWEENFKVEQNHDIYGNLSMEAYYYWSSGAWVGNYKYEYAYDANGKQTMEAYYYWSSGKWKGNYKYERVYDVNGNQIMYASYNWNDSVWVGNYKYEGAYDANGYETLDAYYTWGDSVWVGYYKYEYGYDANGVQIMKAYYDDWSNGKWIGNYRNEWANDANGNLLFSQYQDGWDSTWKYGYKYVNAYDINENQILSEYSVWDTISKTWVKVNRQERAFKDTYIYFTTDFPLYNRYYEWDSTAWELQKSTEWIYNTVGDIIEVVYSELFNDSLKVKTRMLTTTDTTHLRASLVFDEQWEIMFSQHLRTDYYKYDSVQTIIKHDSMLYYWSSINVWSPPTYTISGTVTVDGDPLKGVQITYATSKSVTTNSSGEYTVSVDSGSTVALVPSKAGYVFTPTSITCSNVSSNLYNKDFQATDVGIADVDNTNTELVVYPNPTKGIVYISSECDIKLYDIQGKKLQEIRGNQIDISSYPQGMYFLKVEGKTLKIVKE